MDLETLEQGISIIGSIATVVAIIVGGFWTYFLFVKHRQRFPSANVQHESEQISLPGDKRLVHVAATISNDGKVLVSIESAFTRLQQVLPVPKHILSVIESGKDPVPKDSHEVPWDLLGERNWQYAVGDAEVEPGEEEVLHSEFIVDGCVNAVVIYTYVKNRAKRCREIGWSQTTFLQLGPP